MIVIFCYEILNANDI